MTTFNLVGLTGVAQSGKDTAAQVLIGRYGYKRISFADEVREALYALNPIIGKTPVMGEVVRLSNVVDCYGWHRAKQFPEVRELLQRMGTDVGRKLFGEDFWVNRALSVLDRYLINGVGYKGVIPDVRFDNEAEAIRSRNGIVIAVERPGAAPVNDHASEQGISSHLITHYIRNTATVEQLHAQVIAVLNL